MMHKSWRTGMILALALVLSFVSLAPAQSGQASHLSKLPPLVDRELFFGDPEISGSQLSPDGKFISFIKPYKNVRNIYVKGIDEPFEKAKPVTADARPVPGYFWSQDSRYILYVQDKGGNENFHVYAVNPAAEPEAATGVPPARDLTPLENIRAYIYAVPKNKPNEIITGLNDRDASYHDVYRINLDTGAKELLIKNTENVAAYIYDLDGNVRLAFRQLPDGGSEILRIDDDKLTQIYTVTFEESASPFHFHKDGKRVYMTTNKGENADLSRLVLFDPQTGKEELVETDPERQADFGGAVFSEDTDELIATVYVGDRVRIYPKTAQTKKDLDLLRKKFPQGELNIQSSTRDMRFHLVSVGSDVDPGSVHLYDRQSGEVKLLYRSRPNLPSEYLAPMKAIRYKARDGMEIPAYLTLPKGVDPKNLPVVIHPHGGPWARDTWGYDSYAQFLANRGYAVLQPNFRGSTGYGKKFLNAGNKEWGLGAMQHDITDGVNYLIKQGIADPKRVGIFGGSYGGYATLAGVAFTPDLYAAAVPYVAPSNLITLLESVPAYWIPIIKIFHKRLGDPSNEQDRAALIACSPLFKAEQIKTPMLVVHGANDPRVKKAEADQIVIALRERGLPVEYIVAPDEGHGFRAPENRLALAAAMEKFLAKHLHGRFQQEVSAELTAKLAQLTVDVGTVKLPDTTLAAYALTAPLPKRSPEALRANELQYASTIEARGQKFQMEVARKVDETQLEGARVWRIISATQSQMGAAADTFYLDKQTLLPIRRSVTQGPAVIKVQYLPDAIKGSMKMGAQDTPIEVKLTAPILGDGAALEVTLAALPLAENYETTVRVFDLLARKIRPMSLKVVGKETIAVPAGSFETYKIEMKPLDGEAGGGGIVNFAMDKNRCVVRSQASLPTMMGGGTVMTELIKIGMTTPN